MANSERLTKRWTATTEEAFGPRGKKGREAELFLLKVLSEQFKWEVRDSEENFSDQIRGVDITFRSPNWANWYTADVKGNLQNTGRFYVDTDEDGWLFNSKKVSNRIWHVNPSTGWMVWYDREKMKQYIKSKGLFNKGLFPVDNYSDIKFLTRRKAKVDQL